MMNILERVLDLLKTHDKMTVATVRADGFPQATTVNYVNEELMIYFGCAARSQKARNIERDDRVSLAIDHEYADWSMIQGLSMGGIAEPVSDTQDIERVGNLFTRKIFAAFGLQAGRLAWDRIFQGHTEGHLRDRLHEGLRP